ncbi:hypothetical protein FFR93_00185 [Rhizobium sp. MHM7A]|nr:hypothetical protein FFR93_00185 [Rhizobium sp. MHM7A]
MPVYLRQKTTRLLALTMTVALCHLSDATAGGVRTYGDPPLPLNLKAFEDFVQGLKTATNGNEAAMARQLQALGFSCTPARSTQFQCVRFGCRIGGFLLRGARLQWTVTKYNGVMGNEGFHGAAVDYSYILGCIPKSRVEKEQIDFLSQHGT